MQIVTKRRQLESLHSTPRPGFSLIELLVVLSIIATLISLLLPAVQQAREAARNLQCRNNLRQVGIALHNYVEVKRSFPPGLIWDRIGPNWDASYHRMNWAVSLLPYLERSDLYARWDQNADDTAAANQFVREQPVDVFTCPSDIGTGIDIPMRGVADVPPVAYFHYSSYRGVEGRVDPPYFFPPDRGSWNQLITWVDMPRNHRGIFHIVTSPAYGLSCTENPATITDGLSNTLAIGETHQPASDGGTGTGGSPRNSRTRGTFWAYSRGSTSSVFPYGVTFRMLDFWQCWNAIPPGKPCANGAWGSYHSGGNNWLMADGRVGFISSTADAGLMAKLASIADGESVAVP